MYICVYVCVLCVYLCICMCFMYIFVYMYVFFCIFVYIYVFFCIFVYMYVFYVYICVYLSRWVWTTWIYTLSLKNSGNNQKTPSPWDIEETGAVDESIHYFREMVGMGRGVKSNKYLISATTSTKQLYREVTNFKLFKSKLI